MAAFLSRIIAFFSALLFTFFNLFSTDLNYKYKVCAPVFNDGSYAAVTEKVNDAAFYISVNGDDSNNGSIEEPFATFERAQEAVRNTDKTTGKITGKITVAVMAGEYRVKNIAFNEADSGNENCTVEYTAYGDGEVIINGGATLDTQSFTSVKDAEVLARLNKDAAEKVLCCKLGDEGITAEQYGKLYAIGTYSTAYKYTGDYVGPIYCELFVNDKRMTLARYPDSGFLKTSKVVSTGEGRETDGTLTVNPDWDNIVDPVSDVYEIDHSLADRINSWKTLDDVWMFGFWKYDWADASSPVGSFSYEDKTISPKFVSMYGTKTGAPYYFYNVLEELDSPNEWYLDRENGMLYLYPDDDFSEATVDISLTSNTVITGRGLKNFVLNGFTVKGTRGDGIDISGSNVTVKNCLIKNIAGNAISIDGYDNLVTCCEITHTGRGGIYISGGDRNTLTAGNSKADNNLIHDWSEVYQTYQPAVTLNGVGNICSHNEIYNSPHEAIAYSGNNQCVEYNIIHDVCLLSDDAGAIYSGRRWDNYGTVIRYNCIYNLGSGEHKPNGIYFDDTLSGQTAYGNVLINVPGYSFMIGGGRDIYVNNNIIVNSGKNAIYYDQRGTDGVLGGWFTFSLKGSSIWNYLNDSPWQTDIWKEAYPQMTKFSDDFEDTDNPDFLPNPSYSVVSGNIILDLKKDTLRFEPAVQKYSTVSGNAVYKMTDADKIFVNYSIGDYSLKQNSMLFNDIPGFEPVPVNEIGRY